MTYEWQRDFRAATKEEFYDIWTIAWHLSDDPQGVFFYKELKNFFIDFYFSSFSEFPLHFFWASKNIPSV